MLYIVNILAIFCYSCRPAFERISTCVGVRMDSAKLSLTEAKENLTVLQEGFPDTVHLYVLVVCDIQNFHITI